MNDQSSMLAEAYFDVGQIKAVQKPIPSPDIDLVIDATGSETALTSAIHRLAPQGRLLILGTYPAPVSHQSIRGTRSGNQF